MALDPDDRLFAGDTEMARLMRSHDWAATAVGKPERWPHSLRTIVRTMLTSRFAMWMGWGPDLTFFYNDAYGSMTLGAKHPWALGTAGARGLGGDLAAASSRASTRCSAPARRPGTSGCCSFSSAAAFPRRRTTPSLTARFPTTPAVACGMLCVVTEETERVIGERRLALLRDLGAPASPATSDRRRAVTAAERRRWPTMPRDLPFTLTYHFDRRTARAPGSWRRTGIDPDSSGRMPPSMSDARDVPLAACSGIGSRARVPSCRSRRTVAWPARRLGTPSDAALVVPIAQQGQPRPAGVFVAGLNPYRPFDDAYRNFVGLVVGQMAAGLASARAYEDERRGRPGAG